uniref:Excision repair cross-complementation group 1 n=1 Tax=Eptatretus burgeri TaxID=7764 RepID=A0A8C4NM29_EPTBU
RDSAGGTERLPFPSLGPKYRRFLPLHPVRTEIAPENPVRSPKPRPLAEVCALTSAISLIVMLCFVLLIDSPTANCCSHLLCLCVDVLCFPHYSLRYHHLNPDYIHERLHKLGPAYDLRVLLVQVDVKDPHRTLKELAKMCVLADCTLILAWSSQEAANYLETYKAYENKPADLLKEKTDDDYLSRVTDCLTTVKSINRTDVLTLVNTFGSLADIIKASKEDLSLCPGLGPQKVNNIKICLPC